LLNFSLDQKTMSQVTEGLKSFLKRMVGIDTCSSCQGVLGCCTHFEDGTPKIKMVTDPKELETKQGSEADTERVWIKL
jgi:hypothetical protein